MNVLANIIKINGKDIKDSKATQDIADLKSQIDEISEKGIDASGASDGQVPTADGQGSWAWDDPAGGGAVQDVQVNGVSVLQDGVANVPIANNRPGIVKVGMYGTNGININKNDGTITVAPANLQNIQRAELENKPIASPNAYAAAFYGLAKAAGDTTQSQSSNVVGNYTDNAKDKIQQMLGIVDMIAPHEGAQAANAYSVGDAFCYAGKLYKATASIAIGDAIVPGTNCTQTTLIELIGGI